MRLMGRGRWLRCGLLVAAVCIGPATALAQTREEAVQAARRGEFDAAVSALRTLLAASPSDTATAFDLAVVLEWAGRAREATDVFERTGVAEPPEYVLGAMVRAYRTERRWAEAGALAAQGARRFPANPQWPLAVWMVRGDEAIASGDQFAALGAYLARGCNSRPDDAGIAREVSGILVRLGAPFGAGLQARTRDLGIEAAQAAALVTAAEVGDPALRFQHTDEAIARIDALLADAAAAAPPDSGLMLRLRRDRVIALRDRGRWAATVEAVAALRKDGNAIPPYVRHAEADALLALRRPEDAATAYDEVLAADPSLRSARVGLFFALLEQEDIDGALALVDAMAAEGGPKRGTSANWEWLDAQLLAAIARYYAGQPREAWRRLQPLVEGAPALGVPPLGEGARSRRARGWPRLADEESHIAATLAPPDRSTEIALAEAALSRKRFDEAESRTAALVTLYPEDQAVERLRRSVRAHDAVELRVESEHAVRARQRR